jgi:hypothetical protein
MKLDAFEFSDSSKPRVVDADRWTTASRISWDRILWSPWGKNFLGIMGVWAPMICFIFAVPGLLENKPNLRRSPDSIADYAGWMLSGQATAVFFPLMFFSVVSMWLLIVERQRWEKRLIVRHGIYAGLLLSTQYFAILTVWSHGGFIALQCLLILLFWLVVTLLILPGIFLIKKSNNSSSIAAQVSGMMLGAACALFALLSWPWWLVFFFATTPTWCVLAYAAVAVYLWTTAGFRQFSLRHMLVAFGLLAVYFATWRFAIELMPGTFDDLLRLN